jgi:hypothetical protein
MNIFNKLFGKKLNTETNIANQAYDTNILNSTQDILKDLFIDENPPKQTSDTLSKIDNRLKEMLDFNYQQKGFYDGYEFHSTDILENFKKKLRAEFRYMLEQIIDEKKAEIFRLREELINTEGMSARMQKLLENRIAEIEAVISKMESEKALSSQDEGLIMVPIHNYSDGFIKGTEQYLIEKKLASSTGMFN